MGKYDDLFDEPKGDAKKPGKYDDLFDEPAAVQAFDAGPEARRARSGMAPGPRTADPDEPSGPITTPLPKGKLLDETGMATFPGPRDFGGTPEAHGAPWTNNPEEAGDTMVQTGLLGAGAGKAVGAGLKYAGAAPRVAGLGEAAVGGGTASKTAGGDFTTGAALGVIGPAAGAAVDAAASGAPGRVAARTVRNVTEVAPTKRIADKVTRVAGEEGAQLGAVIDRNPNLRHALAVHAKDRPAAALKSVQDTKALANASRDADFERMQAHYASAPPSSQATISGLLDDTDALLKTKLGDRERQSVLLAARKEISKFGDDLRAAQGLPPAEHGDYSGTVIPPKDLRDFERTIGTKAYEGIPIERQTSIKGKVNAELYAPIARQVHALAEGTPGVDAKRFASTGQDIHVLIPVEEALQGRVTKQAQGRASFIESARSNAGRIAAAIGGGAGGIAGGVKGMIVGAAVPAVAGGIAKAGARVARGIDYRLAEAQRGRLAPPPPAPPSRLLLPVAGTGGADRRRAIPDLYLPPQR